MYVHTHTRTHSLSLSLSYTHAHARARAHTHAHILQSIMFTTTFGIRTMRCLSLPPSKSCPGFCFLSLFLCQHVLSLVAVFSIFIQ